MTFPAPVPEISTANVDKGRAGDQAFGSSSRSDSRCSRTDSRPCVAKMFDSAPRMIAVRAMGVYVAKRAAIPWQSHPTRPSTGHAPHLCLCEYHGLPQSDFEAPFVFRWFGIRYGPASIGKFIGASSAALRVAKGTASALAVDVAASAKFQLESIGVRWRFAAQGDSGLSTIFQEGNCAQFRTGSTLDEFTSGLVPKGFNCQVEGSCSLYSRGK